MICVYIWLALSMFTLTLEDKNFREIQFEMKDNLVANVYQPMKQAEAALCED